MKDPAIPSTPAVRALRAAGASFVPRLYPYVERGGTRHAAECLGVAEHQVIKTLLMEAQWEGGRKRPLLVLMHGDLEVSTKQLARILGVKGVTPASEGDVVRHTGYQPGGVSPFGTRATLPVYMEEGILSLERVYINGGRRGFLVEISPRLIQEVLGGVTVQVGIRA